MDLDSSEEFPNKEPAVKTYSKKNPVIDYQPLAVLVQKKPNQNTSFNVSDDVTLGVDYFDNTFDRVAAGVV